MKLLKVLFVVLGLCCSSLSQAEGINLFEQLQDGGTALVIILALSLLALAVIFERFAHFRIQYIAPPKLIGEVKQLWQAGNFEGIQQKLVRNDSTLARIILFMVQHRLQSFSIVNTSVSEIASIELRRHQQKAYALAIVATVAPIVGLLGTVIGMIESFHVIATADGMGNPALLAGGISKALVNTATGLSVALPALGMHHFFKNRAVFFSLTLEASVNDLMHEWFMPVTGCNAPQTNQLETVHAH